tara:strand:+ start:177 stop:1070 length:894 start_codon:yes stop_codon:yes gene_type:complete
MPLALSIEPTTACNLGCPECPSGLKKFTRKTGNLSLDLHKKIIDENSSNLMYINYYFQGEPYINPNLFKMVQYASSKKIYSSTSTNGHFLNDENCQKTIESGLKNLIISLDGNSQETYESYRKKGDFKKVIEGTKNIVQWKKKLKSKYPYIILQFLVVRENEHLVNEMKQLCKDLELDEFRIKTAQFYDFKNGNPLMPNNEKYSRYKKNKHGHYILKNKLNNSCWRMWSSSVVTVNGELVPCCFDKDAKYQLGNLNHDSFDVIWKNKAYNRFRLNIINNRQGIDICKNCSEGSKVWA